MLIFALSAMLLLLLSAFSKLNPLVSILISVVFFFLSFRLRETFYAIKVQKNRAAERVIEQLQELLTRLGDVDIAQIRPDRVTFKALSERSQVTFGDDGPFSLGMCQALSYEVRKVCGKNYEIYRSFRKTGETKKGEVRFSISGFDVVSPKFKSELEKRKVSGRKETFLLDEDDAYLAVAHEKMRKAELAEAEAASAAEDERDAQGADTLPDAPTDTGDISDTADTNR